MTYNVHGCRGVDRRLDVGRVAAVIAQSHPDIVALQELDVGRPRSGSEDQAHLIAARLGMSVRFHAALQVEEEAYGDAILTGLPETLVKTGPLPVLAGIPRNETRGALWARVEAHGRPLQVITTHFGLVPLEQQRQARRLTGEGWLGHPACADPVVLLGDFNATSRSACYRILCERLQDAQRVCERRGARPVRTFPSRLPMLRIDHVFVSESVRVIDVHAPDASLARIASDHLPLVVDIQLEPQEPTDTSP